MTKNTTLQTTVYRITRAGVSYLGNPAYIFHTSDGKLKTVANSGAAYALENDFTVNEKLDLEVQLNLTARGTVKDWRKL